MERYKVAIIGGKTSAMGFKAVGVEPYTAAVPEEGPEIWRSLPQERYAIVMITEPIYGVLLEKVPGFPPQGRLPIVLVIPAVTGSQGMGLEILKRKVEKAVGADIESGG